MSIEQQSLDSQLIEQTKQQIRSIVAEIAQLSKANVAPEEFYAEFLPRVVSALAAVGGAVWALNSEGQLALQYQINIQETGLRENADGQAQHSRLLYKAMAAPEGMLVPPHSGPGDVDTRQQPGQGQTPAANPTDFLLVLGLLKTDLETVGVVEVFQRAESGLNTQKGYLRFLMQMCELAGEFLKSHQLRHFSTRQTLWTQLEDFTRGVHASLDPRETAYTIANEGRRLIECDRVSVAIRKGERCFVEAISGQDLFDKRSNIVRLLNRLTSAVVATGEAVWYTGDTRDMAPQVEEALQEYIDESHSKLVAILPLARPAPPETDDKKDRIEPEEPIGALVVEQIEDSRIANSLVQRSDVVCQHSAAALANAMEHQSLFLMPVWRAIGKSRWIIEARTLPKTLSITGALLVLLLILAVWPAHFTLEAKGTLEPVVRQDVFANVDGEIEELKCDHGDIVTAGQPLMQLRNTELQVALIDVQGQRLANSERLASAMRMLTERKLPPEDEARLSGERAEAIQKQRTFDAQIELYKKKQSELSVRSPLDGVVVTWDLRNRLIHRPVKRGQVLVRVADPKGPWQLELHMPENRMGFIVKAQQDEYDRSREKLRGMLAEDVRAKLGEEATQEQIDQEVNTMLADISGPRLREKILEEYFMRWKAQLQPILDTVADPALREKLDALMREKSYETALAQTALLTPTVEDPDLKTRLEALPKEQWDDRLLVSYILATEPGTTRYGRVSEIHRSAEVRGDEGNTVMIRVAINDAELPDKRPGATVTGQVYCGWASLGYTLLHDVFSFIQSRILFRYF